MKPKKKLTLSGVLKYILPLVLIAVAVVVIYPNFRTEWPKIPEVLRASDKTLLIWLILLQSLIYLFDGSLSYTLLSILEVRVKWRHAVRIAILSAISGKILPVVGNALTAFFFYGKLKVRLREVLFVIFSWNFLYIVNFLAFFGLALIFAPSSFHAVVHPTGFWGIVIVFATAIIAAVVLLVNRGRNLIRLTKFLSRVTKRDLNAEGIVKSLHEFYEDLRLLRSKKALTLRALGLSALYYLDNVVVLYFSFIVFHYHPNFLVVALGFNFSTILALITLVPEVPGVTEASMALVFVAFGYPVHIAVLTSILYRFVSYWILLPLGAHSYYKLKQAYGERKRN